MKAAVFHKAGDIRYDTVPDPRIEQATDVILRVTSTAICGSDLHILSGAVPQTEPMIMGHEFMGIVEEVGAYPHGRDYDINKGEPGERPGTDENIRKVPLPLNDPLLGHTGGLPGLWKEVIN
jgi:NADPH:quinone reductase-like Zn-dependent oxidoreductase